MAFGYRIEASSEKVEGERSAFLGPGSSYIKFIYIGFYWNKKN